MVKIEAHMSGPEVSATRRFVGSAFVLFLHVAVIALLLYSMRIVPVAIPNAHEIILRFLPRAVTPPPAVVKSPLPHAPRSKPNSSATLPDYSGIIWLPTTPHAGPPAGSGAACDNPQNLDPQQRLECARTRGLQLPPPDYRDHTDRAVQADRWYRERQRKNGPPLLPCMNPVSGGISLGTIICAVKGVTQGYDPDEQPMYGDTPEDVHVPNNGDPPPIYSPDH
jgi:hypothetical protein